MGQAQPSSFPRHSLTGAVTGRRLLTAAAERAQARGSARALRPATCEMLASEPSRKALGRPGSEAVALAAACKGDSAGKLPLHSSLNYGAWPGPDGQSRALGLALKHWCFSKAPQTVFMCSQGQNYCSVVSRRFGKLSFPGDVLEGGRREEPPSALLTPQKKAQRHLSTCGN